MSRQIYLLGWGLTLVAGAFLLTDALLWEPGVTEANVQRVQEGMTLEQVEAWLGERAGEPSQRYNLLSAKKAPPWNRTWFGPEGAVCVMFDEYNRVESSVFFPARQPTPSPLARLRAWLGW